jgi:TIR domain
MSSPHATPSRTALREFIFERFSREELLAFVLDYFRDFYDEYEGMNLPKTPLVNNLITHCERRDSFLHLQTSLQLARPEPYAAAFAHIDIVRVPTHPRDPRQIFLSYSSKDLTLAQRIANDLRNAGFKVFFAYDSIAKGEKWTSAIDRGLNESSMFVVMLTPNAVQSEWVKEETDIALERKDVFRFFSLMMRTCEVQHLSNRLILRQHIEFEHDYDEGFAALCQALGVTQHGSKRSERFEPSSPAPLTLPLSSTWRVLQQKVDAVLANKQWAEATRLLETWHALDPDDADAAAAQTRLRELRRADEAAARAAQLIELWPRRTGPRPHATPQSGCNWNPAKPAPSVR